ncbi:MAG: DUF3048 domain-containing protein [Candidatus Dormibacteraceae bacterium]
MALLAAFWLAACAGQPALPVTPAVQPADPATPTLPLPTATLAPSPTPSPMPPTSTATAAATATVTPTAVPSAPTATPTPFKALGAIGVMIDNDPSARPQTGLSGANVVYEMVAEFNLTRFLAVYFVDAPTTVGSMRSTRPYFAAAMTEYGGGLVHCLDVPGVTKILDQGNVFNFDVCHGAGEEGAFRVSSRVAPFNLYANAALLQGELRLRPPRPAAALLPRRSLPSGAMATKGVSIVYPFYPAADEHTVDWTWNGQVYTRQQDGAPHRAADGRVVTTDVIVVQRAQTRPTSYFGDAGYHVVDLIGSGDALLLAEGRSQPAHWQRASPGQPTIFTTADGQVLPLPPGRIFFEVVPTNAEVDLNP